MYSDACGWDNVLSSPTHRSCILSDNKTGGNITVTYQVKILSVPGGVFTNPEPLSTLIYDFSGSSYHYNADFGISSRYAYVLDPATVDISKSFSPPIVASGSSSTLTFRFTNSSHVTVSSISFNDDLPSLSDETTTGQMVVSDPVTYSTSGCGSPTFSPAAGAKSLSFSNGTIAPNGTCSISVSVTVPDTPSTGIYTNVSDNVYVGGLDSGHNATASLTVDSTGITPAAAGPFYNLASASGETPIGAIVADESSDGPDPDNTTNCPACVNGDGDPTNNTQTTKINFDPNIFDPPFGFKELDASGLSVLRWTMIWINDNNFPSVSAVNDPIPVGATYEATGASSGYLLPAGAPAGSSNQVVSCTTDSITEPASGDAETATTLCYYEGPTVTYLRGRIVWEGLLGPDMGATDQASANDELYITFNLRVTTGVTTVQNTASIGADLNNDADLMDPGETVVATARATWQEPATPIDGQEGRRLPGTGFAPGKVTALPRQWPEQAGWLQGTAFPTWHGNSVLTAHVYLPNGKPRPFVDLSWLCFGDQAIIHAFGQRYVYKIRTNHVILPTNMSPFQHEEKAWLTLLTCKGYEESTDTYKYRVVVRAVLMKVEAEP